MRRPNPTSASRRRIAQPRSRTRAGGSVLPFSSASAHAGRVERRVRLDRALSKLGVASRSQAKDLIAAGLVRVRGKVVTDRARLVGPDLRTIQLAGVDSAAGA